jgi:hypothetical protein
MPFGKLRYKNRVERLDDTKQSYEQSQLLYFLMNFKYSSNEILPLLSLSICEKFHLTISSVTWIFSGLNVSSINLLNSVRSIRSSSLPSLP